MVSIILKHVMRPSLFLGLLLVFTAAAMNQFGNDLKVTYGSLVRLTNPASNFILNSHNVPFRPGGLMSATGFRADNLGAFWQINQKHQQYRKTYRDSVQCGDTITLTSAVYGYSLRVEETQFGLTTELLPVVHGMANTNLDEKINWVVQCVDKEAGADIHFNDKVRLKHQVTGKYASLDPSYVYTPGNCGRGCTIVGHIELHALDTADDATTVFQIKTGLTFEHSSVETE